MSFEPAAVAAALAGLGDGVLATGTVLGTPVDTPSVELVPTAWAPALLLLRDGLGLAWFDWLTVVDESGRDDSVRVVASLKAADGPSAGHGVLVNCRVPAADPVVATATDAYPGAAWHEREAHEMFGVRFEGHPDLRPLLLPEGFEGNPLRKGFVLAARVAKQWPGEHEPSGKVRRRQLPPGVPEPGTWGPAS